MQTSAAGPIALERERERERENGGTWPKKKRQCKKDSVINKEKVHKGRDIADHVHNREKLCHNREKTP